MMTRPMDWPEIVLNEHDPPEPIVFTWGVHPRDYWCSYVVLPQPVKTRNLPDYVLAFVDFVALAERKEKETGEPCTVIASC